MKDFIKTEIESLDIKIENARAAVTKMEQSQIDERDKKTYEVLRAKISDWVTKRDRLLDLVISQVKSNGKL
ncbi:hypothetical protein WSM22_35050 [Cytophagales bacterium WSM2-2]|nr:hypothetical protein WSM22_35050 [Cytophagales bacterium WSM2-2]